MNLSQTSTIHNTPSADVNLLMWEADPHTLQFTYVSRGAEQMLGYSLDRWLTKPSFWLEVIHRDDRERAVSYFRAAIASCRDHEVEYRMIAADGRELRVRDHLRVICDSARRPLALRGVMVDITARPERDSSESAADQYYRALVEQTLDLVTVVNREGAILYESPSASRVLGVDPASRVGRRVFELVHPDDLTSAWRVFHQAFSTGDPSPLVEFRCRHADGSWRTLEAVGRQVQIDQGHTVGIINSRDITERRIVEERVREAEKMEAIGRLAGSIAHDFNNVVSAIHGNAELALQQRVSDPVGRSLTDIRQAAEIGLNLARQLLLFSRGSLPATEAVDVNAAIRKLRPMLERLVDRGITLDLRLDSRPAPVLLAPGAIEQVLMNLAVNARDAMPHGGTLTIETLPPADGARGHSGSRQLLIEVTDTGAGMSADVRARIFEPFFTTKQLGQGSGLGLPTIYRIVKSVGGQIDVVSEPGRGSRFIITLPIARQ